MPKVVRVKCYPKLQKLWHEVCSNCQKTIDELNIIPFDAVAGIGGLEIHHIRYDVPLDDVRFQRFMCHGCNHKKEFSISELERYNKELSGSMLSNIDKCEIFQEWWSNEMVENNYHMPRHEIIAGGAYVSGANVITVGRWLIPLSEHKNAPFARAVISGVDTIFLRGRSFGKFDDSSKYK